MEKKENKGCLPEAQRLDEHCLLRNYSGVMQDEKFEEFYCILCESFPEEERRTREAQHSLLNQEEYHILEIEQQGRMIGFLAYWDFGEFLYGEHFALQSCCRGRGIGTRVLHKMLGSGRTVIGEVEPPKTEQARRRIALYQREGFRLWDHYEYYQQPLRAGQQPLPLILISNREKETQESLDHYKNVLYLQVYHCVTK